MNKSDLVELVFNEQKYLTRNDVEQCVNEVLSFSSENLAKGNRIEIRGFGTFSSRERKKRLARNPKTGTAIEVEPKFHPYFRASKYLKNSLKV